MRALIPLWSLKDSKLEMATKSFHKGKIKCSEGKSNKEQCIFVNW